MNRFERFVGHLQYQRNGLSLFSRTIPSSVSSISSISSRSITTSKNPAETQVDVMVVGCGLPRRSMGWYHAKQLLDGRCPSARLSQMVDSRWGPELQAWAAEEAAGVEQAKSVESATKPPYGTKKLAIIASRTADMPKNFYQCLKAGCSHIYLEKPGATNYSDLEAMASAAETAGVPVYMGYNKNVTQYVRQARDAEAKLGDTAFTTFVHNNAYTPDELDECFERNSEGMLKNMAVHELALLCTYYGVAVDNIKSVTPDLDYSRCETRGGYTDFSKLGFTLETTAGKKVAVRADRCGGNFSEAYVSVDGVVQFHAKTPDPALEAVIKAHEVREPGLMPYFYLNDEDYATLKQRVAASVITGKPADGLASIQVAIDTLKVAEYLTPILAEALQR